MTTLFEKTIRHFLSPITSLLDDPDVSEIMINGFQTVYLERSGRIERSTVCFPSDAALMAAVRNIAEFMGRDIDDRSPTMDARLPDGSRVHVIIPPASRSGIVLTIRRFKEATFDLDTLVASESITALAAEFLSIAVMLHKNIVISGGTGTGKTSMLNALSARIPKHERIVVIEDSSELRLRQPHTIYLEAQPADANGEGQISIRELFANSLRMRPDRIVVGEVRRGEALDLIQSMISGHSGSLTTVHANSPRDATMRLETLCLMNDVGLPVYVARQQVASAVSLVLQIARLGDGSRRVMSISECLGLDADNQYQWRDLFRFHPTGRDADGRIIGTLDATGAQPEFHAEAFAMGLDDHIRLTRSMFSRDAD